MDASLPLAIFFVWWLAHLEPCAAEVRISYTSFLFTGPGRCGIFFLFNQVICSIYTLYTVNVYQCQLINKLQPRCNKSTRHMLGHVGLRFEVSHRGAAHEASRRRFVTFFHVIFFGYIAIATFMTVKWCNTTSQFQDRFKEHHYCRLVINPMTLVRCQLIWTVGHRWAQRRRMRLKAPWSRWSCDGLTDSDGDVMIASLVTRPFLKRCLVDQNPSVIFGCGEWCGKTT